MKKVKPYELDSDEIEILKRLAVLHYKIQNGGISEQEHELYEDFKDCLRNILPIAS